MIQVNTDVSDKSAVTIFRIMQNSATNKNWGNCSVLVYDATFITVVRGKLLLSGISKLVRKVGTCVLIYSGGGYNEQFLSIKSG
jgi:hypothetical protein